MGLHVALLLKIDQKSKMSISEIKTQNFNHSPNSQGFVKTTWKFNGRCKKPST